MKRSLINLVGVMLAPLFIILLVLDIFFWYLSSLEAPFASRLHFIACFI